jgi:polyisoprenyl-phosphate glycosyltransferase
LTLEQQEIHRQLQAMISVVSPVYRAEGMVSELVTRVREVMQACGLPYELILVEDGSPDSSWAELAQQCALFEEVRGVRLSRNFGQHNAITAGLDMAKGDWVVVMDCDLQDRPEEIPRLLAKAQEGYDVVLASRAVRQDNLWKRASSAMFYGALSYLTGTRQDASVANFGIYSRKVIDAVTSMRESIRYFPTMVQWVGFKQCVLEVTHAPRAKGDTSYSLNRLLHLALDIMLAYSDKPLRLTIKLGLMVALFGFAVAGWTFVNWLLGNLSDNPLGYASLFFSIWILSGFMLITLGMVGLYVGKTFEGVKNRPIYVIAEQR